MARKLTLLVVSTFSLITVAVAACAPSAAPTPTSLPPTKAPAAAPTAAATSAAAPTTAAVGTTAPAAAGDVAAGKTAFDQNCGACHPGGQRGVGPTLAGRNLSASTITTRVRSGGGSMPAFSTSQISDQHLSNIVAYVQSLK